MNNKHTTLIRFVSQEKHPDTGELNGIFIAAYELHSGLELSSSDRDLLKNLLDWFTHQLKTPGRFNRTKSKGYYRRSTSGIAWLKDSAQTHISKMRELSEVLGRYGYSISVIKTKNPGYVVYEDEHQIIAEPFSDT